MGGSTDADNFDAPIARIARSDHEVQRTGLVNPARYRDREMDWSSFWHERRRHQIVSLVTPALIAEHRADPAGMRRQHSADLQKVLTYLRTTTQPNRRFIYAERPFASYRAAVLANEDQAEVGPEWTTENDAAHAVFLERLADLGVDAELLRASS